MVSTITSQQEGPGFNSRSGFFGAKFNPMSLPGFSPGPKTYKLGIRLTGHSKFPVGVNVSGDGCLSLYVGPVMN